MGFTNVTIKVTKVTTGHKKLPKLGPNSITSSFLPKKSLGQRPKPSAGARRSPHNGSYLLVNPYLKMTVTHSGPVGEQFDLTLTQS